MTVSIVTPWLDHSELIPVYEHATRGAQIVVVDNGSKPEHATRISEMCCHNRGLYIRSDTNLGYSRANNLGIEAATGEVVVCMNNDVQKRGDWVHLVAAEVAPGALYGPSMPPPKHGAAYIEGWCIAAHRDTWAVLGGWDADYYRGLYWEDNDLCWRATQAGIKLIRVNWPLWHYGNYTSSRTPGAYDASADNQRLFLERIGGRE